MRIISKYTDYYDSANAWGIDAGITYVRNEEFQPLISSKFNRDHFDARYNKAFNIASQLKERWFNETNSYLRYHIGFVGFCGKIYPFITKPHLTSSGARITKKVHTGAYLDKTEYIFQSNRYLVLALSDGHDKKRSVDVYRHAFRPMENIEIFREFNTPVFAFNTHIHDGVTTNPLLRELGFASVIDPVTTFQEIAMFIPNILTSSDDPAQITDDKVIAAAKGHGGKYSFRKMPEDN